MSLDDEITSMIAARMGVEFDLLANACTASTTTAADLNLDNMRERIQHVMDALEDFDRRDARANETVRFAEVLFGAEMKPWQHEMLRFAGLPVTESPIAMTMEPIRVHRHRRNQSAAYHRRIQKKWTKRFGTRPVPCAYMLNAEALAPWAAHGSILVCHPEIAKRLREAGPR